MRLTLAVRSFQSAPHRSDAARGCFCGVAEMLTRDVTAIGRTAAGDRLSPLASRGLVFRAELACSGFLKTQENIYFRRQKRIAATVGWTEIPSGAQQ